MNMKVETLHFWTLRPTRPDERYCGVVGVVEGVCQQGNYLIPDAKTTKVIMPYHTESSKNGSARRFYNILWDFNLTDMGSYPMNPSTDERPAINYETNSSPQTQEVRLEYGSDDGKLMDIGHLFAGLDAYYHPRSVRIGAFDITKNIDADEVHNNLPLPHSHHIQESTTYIVVRSKDVHTEGGKEREKQTRSCVKAW